MAHPLEVTEQRALGHMSAWGTKGSTLLNMTTITEVSYRSLEYWVSGWNLKEFLEKCGGCGALWVVGFTPTPSKIIVGGC